MDRWLFVHIMKTAGTSFRMMLNQQLEDAVYPTRAELMAQPNGWYIRAPDLLERLANGRIDLSARRVICGHFPAALADHLPGTFRTATFIREPVGRALSMIAHRHRSEQGGKLRQRINRLLNIHKLNVSEYLERTGLIQGQIANYQTKIFAMGVTDAVNKPFVIDEYAFSRAKDRLLAMDFVGLTEEFEESIRLFEGMSGISFSDRIVHANKSRLYGATEEEIARIRELVRYDLALYEIAREKMRAQSARIDAAATRDASAEPRVDAPARP